MTWTQWAEAGYTAAKIYLSAWLRPLPKSTAEEEKPEAQPVGLAAYKPDFTRCVDHFAIHAGERCAKKVAPLLPH